MPEVNGNGDRMSLHFPAPPLETEPTMSEDFGWESPTHTLTDTPDNDTYFTFKPQPKDLKVDELILETIKRLSAELENRSGTPDTISPASTISNLDNYSTPSTPSEPRSPDFSALETSRSFTLPVLLSQDEQDERDDLLLQQQQRPQSLPRTITNRKLAMVRRQEYRGSNLRIEVRFDDDRPVFPYSLDTGNFAAWGRSPAPSPWPADGNTVRRRAPESTWTPCTKGVYCEDDECDHTPPAAPPQKPYELEDEKKDRFPTSEELKFYGDPCSSPVCSAPGSRTRPQERCQVIPAPRQTERAVLEKNSSQQSPSKTAFPPSDHLIASTLDRSIEHLPITRVSMMAHAISPSAFSSWPSGALFMSNVVTRPNGLMALNELSPQDQEQLGDMLQHKLRGIPTDHIPSLRLSDVLQRTPRTLLPHIPPDISLAWFLRNRARVDSYIRTGMQHAGVGEEAEDVDDKVVRAAWYYRLSASHQFQRYHDAVRWNLAIYTALLTQHTLSKSRDNGTTTNNNRKSKIDKTLSEKLSPAALRFVHAYLSAVLEQHNAPTQFSKRDAFIQLWLSSRFDLFSIHKSWAKKALRRALKALGSEWAILLSQIGSEYETRMRREKLDTEARDAEVRDTGIKRRGDANELLDALRAPFPTLVAGQRALEPVEDEMAMVCDLRTAITCVQSTQPRDMLPVLMRLFPFSENEA
ncbi:hypothetical protein E8E11_002906 [Didymella keratinophila]|nr:hypothetical protein E8E11_002906 [Didymella keratinophila]